MAYLNKSVTCELNEAYYPPVGGLNQRRESTFLHREAHITWQVYLFPYTRFLLNMKKGKRRHLRVAPHANGLHAMNKKKEGL